MHVSLIQYTAIDAYSYPSLYKCHPLRSSICSVNTIGLIYIWATVSTEKWGAFAAHFEELDENIEYEEKEDEFDIVSQQGYRFDHLAYSNIPQEDEEVLRKRKRDEEEHDVDVTAVDEDQDPGLYPTSEFIDDPNNPESASNRQWLDDDPDDDTVHDFFPPVFMEDDIPNEDMY